MRGLVFIGVLLVLVVSVQGVSLVKIDVPEAPPGYLNYIVFQTTPDADCVLRPGLWFLSSRPVPKEYAAIVPGINTYYCRTGEVLDFQMQTRSSPAPVIAFCLVILMLMLAM
jgi:hypothetical protein